MKRILVTGSRDWTDEDSVRRALVAHGPGLLVHGASRGLDTIAARVAVELGWGAPEAFPADWKTFGRAAGPARNQEMVNAGADVCLVFPIRGSRGTYDCAARARRAGIPLVIVRYPGGPTNFEINHAIDSAEALLGG